MFYFKTRSNARSFASKRDHYQFVDNGAQSQSGQRWGVKVIK